MRTVIAVDERSPARQLRYDQADFDRVSLVPQRQAYGGSGHLLLSKADELIGTH